MSSTAAIPLVPLPAGATQASGAGTTATTPPVPPFTSVSPSAQTQTQHVPTSASGQITTVPTPLTSTPIANTIPNLPNVNSAQSSTGSRYWSTFAHANVSLATWLGVGLAIGALLIAIYYGAPMYRLAIWTARNDFRAACVNDRSNGLTSAACNLTLLDPASPPPFSKRSLELSILTPTATRPFALASTAIAGVLIIVSVFTVFRRYLDKRPVPVVSYVRADLPCIVALPDTSINNVLTDGCALVYIPLRRGRGIALQNGSKASHVDGPPCIFCAVGSIDNGAAQSGSHTTTICGHRVHNQCIAQYVQAKGIDCPSCGGALGIVCDYHQLSRKDSNSDASAQSLKRIRGKRRRSSISTDGSSRRLAFHKEDDSSPLSQRVRPLSGMEDQKLQFVLQMPRHAVALESSRQYEAAIDAYVNICQLLDMRVSRLGSSDKLSILELTDARIFYHNQADKLRRALQLPSPRLITEASTELPSLTDGDHRDEYIADMDTKFADAMREFDAWVDSLGREPIQDTTMLDSNPLGTDCMRKKKSKKVCVSSKSRYHEGKEES